MAHFNGNNPYLTIGGTAFHAKFISVDLQFGGSSVETTAGAGRTHMQRNAGLRDNTMTVVLSYDDTSPATDMAGLIAQTAYSVEYGPESNVSGKPRHVQSFILDSLDPSEQTVQKAHMTFTLNFVGADEPSVDMNAGGVYA